MKQPAAVFFGTPEFAVPSLGSVAKLARVCLVVTQPDRPAGRGRKVRPTPVSQAAREMDIEVIQPRRIKDPALHERLRACVATFFFVTAYGRILPEEILNIPPMGCLNLHASLLPRHRGAAPIQWAILEGDSETGLTLMKMDAGMDTGPIIAATRMAIGQNETAGELSDRLARASERFIEENLDRYVAGELVPEPQLAQGATEAPRIFKKDGLVDWTRPATRVASQIRAMTPWPGARTCVGDRQVCIHAVRLPAAAEEGPPEAEAGTLFMGNGRMRVRCGQGWLEITLIQAAGKRCLEAADFVRGSRLGPCTVLTREPR